MRIVASFSSTASRTDCALTGFATNGPKAPSKIVNIATSGMSSGFARDMDRVTDLRNTGSQELARCKKGRPFEPPQVF